MIAVVESDQIDKDFHLESSHWEVYRDNVLGRKAAPVGIAGTKV